MFEYKNDMDVSLIQSIGGDREIAAAAWVCTSAEEGLERARCKPDDVGGVINYLMKHSHGCYSSDSEVLTSKGWKKWPEVDGTELFVTLNMETDDIELQAADRVVHKPLEGGYMIRLKMTTGVDALVTPDHNMYAAPRTSRGAWDWRLYPARQFLDRGHRVRLGGGNWDGQLHRPKIAEMIGFIAADGHVDANTICFHLYKGRKIEWLLERHDVNFDKGDKYRLKDVSSELNKWSKLTYTKTGDRCFPREILENGDAQTIRAMLDGYLEGDGHVTALGKITCSTVSRQLVDDIQEAALKCGLAAIETSPDLTRNGAYGENPRPLYKITIYRERNMMPFVGKNEPDRQEQVQVVPYEGLVHCVTVPNGTLYVRRNGKVMWCGNTPFEHNSMTFYVRAPIFVWREYHRHRIGFSYNEESGRYKTLDPVFYLPTTDRPMMKVDGWKPGRPKFTQCENIETYQQLCDNLRTSYELAYLTYLKNLELGVDPGLARDCLPVGIYSGCWVTCNARSLMAFLALRTSKAGKSYPLREIEMVAEQQEAIFQQLFPLTYAAFEMNGRQAP